MFLMGIMTILILLQAFLAQGTTRAMYMVAAGCFSIASAIYMTGGF